MVHDTTQDELSMTPKTPNKKPPMFDYVAVFANNLIYLLGMGIHVNRYSIEESWKEIRSSWWEGLETFTTPWANWLCHPLTDYAHATGGSVDLDAPFKDHYKFWQGLQKDLSDRGIGYYFPTWVYFIRAVLGTVILMALWGLPLVLLLCIPILPILAVIIGGGLAVWLGSAWLVFRALGVL